MKTLLYKDFLNARSALLPALLLGLPLILILQFTTQETERGPLAWTSAYWIVYFFSAVNLLYRSFSFEHRSQNFILYSAFQIAPIKIFCSQALLHFLSLLFMGLVYLGLIFVFWSFPFHDMERLMTALLLSSLCLAPVGTCLGLMLQTEREFLFSLFFLPLTTPVILGAHALSLEWTTSWGSVLGIFALMGSFVSALIFEFFFDELSQTN